MGKLRRRVGKFVRKPLEAISGYGLEVHGSGIVLLQSAAVPKASDKAKLYGYLSDLELAALFDACDVNLVLDVGANRGQFASRLRSDIGYNGDIYSFEPVSSAYALLESASADDPRWRVFKLALGSQAATMKINVTDTSEFSSFLAPNERCDDYFKDESKVGRQETVQTTRLDTFLDNTVSALDSARIPIRAGG